MAQYRGELVAFREIFLASFAPLVARRKDLDRGDQPAFVHVPDLDGKVRIGSGISVATRTGAAAIPKLRPRPELPVQQRRYRDIWAPRYVGIDQISVKKRSVKRAGNAAEASGSTAARTPRRVDRGNSSRSNLRDTGPSPETATAWLLLRIQTRRKILFRYRWSRNSHSIARVPIGRITGPNEPEYRATPPKKKWAISSNGMIRVAM